MLDGANAGQQQYKSDYDHGESNILVAIRIRPLNQKEVINHDFDIARVEDNLIVSLDTKTFPETIFRLFLTQLKWNSKPRRKECSKSCTGKTLLLYPAQ